MARRFFYICAGMLMLALSYHFGASTAGAQSAGIAAPSEVAALSGLLRNGETIPLPTYADGTTALESECRWIVSPAIDFGGASWCLAADGSYGNIFDVQYAATSSFFTAHRGRVVNCPTSNVPQEAVNFLIIATRGASQPTTALHQSWGQVKALYHPTPGMTVTPGADTR
jgi:hypothetical protein